MNEKNFNGQAVTPQQLIELLDLSPLPEEGGMTNQTYCSRWTIGEEPGGT